MSFLSDLFEGHTSNLGTDLSHAGSSFINHPTEMLETAGAAALPFAAFAAPALAGAAGGLFGGAADAVGGLFSGAADAAGGLFGGAADAALPEGSTLASFVDPASSTATGADPFGSLNADLAVNPNMTDPNAFSAANQVAGIGSSNPGAGADASASLQSLTGGTDPAALPGNSTVASTDFAGGSNAGGTGQTGGQSFYDKPVSGVKNALGNAVDQLTKNPIGPLAAAGGLAYNLSQANRQLPNQAALQQQANALTPQAQQFMSYLQNGTLPAGMQAAVDKAAAAQRARVIANHAAAGQSTDPTQNSALAQELAQVDQNTLIAVAQGGEQLFSSGLSEAQLSSQIMNNLLQVEQKQTQAMGTAISNFATALSGGVRIPGTNATVNTQQAA